MVNDNDGQIETIKNIMKKRNDDLARQCCSMFFVHHFESAHGVRRWICIHVDAWRASSTVVDCTTNWLELRPSLWRANNADSAAGDSVESRRRPLAVCCTLSEDSR